MTTIIKPGIERILKIFYKKDKIHLRAISRETNMYGQSVTRYLNELEKEKILKSKKEGNLKIYSWDKNNKVYSIKTLFDLERLEKLPFQRKEAIKGYIKILPEKPVFAILFGSTAKNNFSKDSDIDILIVTNNKFSSKEAEKEVDTIYGIKMSTFQISYKEFIKELKLKEDKVVQSAILTGYPIFNNNYYYEVLDNERI